MAITNYTELQSAVADFLNRTDLTAVVPTFIGLAEAQMERALRVRQMVKRSTADIDTAYSAVPADFLEAKTFKLNTDPVQPLEFVTPEQIDALQAQSGAAGRPMYFSVIGTELRVYPAPDSTYSGELMYYARLQKLTDVAPVNWLITLYPDAYLYGSLLQAAPYLKDDERMAVWGTLFNTAMESIKFADHGARASGLLKVRSRAFGAR